MMLKLYLGISVLALALAVLVQREAKSYLETKYSKEIEEGKITVAKENTKLLSLLRMIVPCFIPIFHLVMIGIEIFGKEMTEKKIDEEVKKRLKTN